MKSTPTCNCGEWVWDSGTQTWHNRHGPVGYEELQSSYCSGCGEELPANPEDKEEVTEILLYLYAVQRREGIKCCAQVLVPEYIPLPQNGSATK